jgi:hypothetical protein
MTIEQFWQIIEECRAAADRGASRIEALQKLVSRLSPREMVSFEGHLWDLLSISYRREIWAVATIIDPAFNQGDFEAIRAWMILEGREFFDAVALDAQRLADRVPPGKVFWLSDGDRLLNMVQHLYRAVARDELPTLPRTVPYALKGQRWSDDDLPSLYPELWQKYRSR